MQRCRLLWPNLLSTALQRGTHRVWEDWITTVTYRRGDRGSFSTRNTVLTVLPMLIPSGSLRTETRTRMFGHRDASAATNYSRKTLLLCMCETNVRWYGSYSILWAFTCPTWPIILGREQDIHMQPTLHSNLKWRWVFVILSALKEGGGRPHQSDGVGPPRKRILITYFTLSLKFWSLLTSYCRHGPASA